MIRLLLAITATLLLTAHAGAETLYVSEALATPLRASSAGDARQVALVPAGTAAEVLQRSPDGKWVRVRIGGQEGWLPAADLQSQPAARERLSELQVRNDTLQREKQLLETRLRDLEFEAQTLRTSNTQLVQERDSALAQLGDLRLVAAPGEQTVSTQRALTEQAQSLAIEKERLQAEVERLRADRESTFFFYGALVVFVALLVGWVIARQAGQRRKW